MYVVFLPEFTFKTLEELPKVFKPYVCFGDYEGLVSFADDPTPPEWKAVRDLMYSRIRSEIIRSILGLGLEKYDA